MPSDPSTPPEPAVASIPHGLRVGALYAGCLLVITAAVAVVGVLVWYLAAIVVPALLGLLLCALLMPFCRMLLRHHWPRWAAIAVAWLLILVLIAALATLVVQQTVANWDELAKQIDALFVAIQSAVDKHPMGFNKTRVGELGEQISEWLQEHAQDIGLQTWIAGMGAVRIITGSVIAVLVSIFLLLDGANIWNWIVRLFPRAAQPRLDAAGHAGWHVLVEFPRVQVMVAAFDAVLIGLGALIIGIPLALPVATLVFFGALIPIVGAIATGLVAVLLALLAKGWGSAAFMLVVVLVVNQVESHILQPLLAGNAFRIHPLVVVLAVVAGISIGGVAGAFFAVPLVATASAMVTAAKRGHAFELAQ